jgi:hypothetical protein
MREYSPREIGRQTAELGFSRDPFEKMLCLAGVLAFFEHDPTLAKYLALKGNPAII